MNAKTPRELFAQAMIVLAVCIGAWMMLVKPKVDELARLDLKMAEQDAGPSETMTQETVEDAARKISALKERVRDIDAFNALASDSSRLYGIVMDLADSHGVQVHSLQPGSVRQTSEDGKMTITRITLGAEGEYARLASFLDGVCNIKAFIRPVSLQLDPSREAMRTTVEATLTCDVLTFAMDSALVDLLASANTRPSPALLHSAMGGPANANP